MKSTTNSNLMSFPVSAAEWNCAVEKGSNYHILRILRVGRPNVAIVQLTDPVNLALRKDVQLKLEPMGQQ